MLQSTLLFCFTILGLSDARIKGGAWEDSTVAQEATVGNGGTGSNEVGCESPCCDAI